jgi:hypothetical protein
MSNTSSRCEVCNTLSHGERFCSKECEDEYNEVSERLWEINQDSDVEEYALSFEDEDPPYLDDYYAPYKKEWLN